MRLTKESTVSSVKLKKMVKDVEEKGKEINVNWFT